MLAVKRSRDGISKGGGAEIFGEHPSPRYGLQRAPVHTGSRQQQEDQQSVANPTHYGELLAYGPVGVKGTGQVSKNGGYSRWPHQSCLRFGHPA